MSLENATEFVAQQLKPVVTGAFLCVKESFGNLYRKQEWTGAVRPTEVDVLDGLTKGVRNILNNFRLAYGVGWLALAERLMATPNSTAINGRRNGVGCRQRARYSTLLECRTRFAPSCLTSTDGDFVRQFNRGDLTNCGARLRGCTTFRDLARGWRLHAFLLGDQRITSIGHPRPSPVC